MKGSRVSAPEDALYYAWREDTEKDADIRLVPYFAWNNRGTGEMRVWLQLR